MSEEVRILSRYHTEHDASAATIVRQLVDALDGIEVAFSSHVVAVHPDETIDQRPSILTARTALTAARTWLEQEAR